MVGINLCSFLYSILRTTAIRYFRETFCPGYTRHRSLRRLPDRLGLDPREIFNMIFRRNIRLRTGLTFSKKKFNGSLYAAVLFDSGSEINKSIGLYLKRINSPFQAIDRLDDVYDDYIEMKEAFPCLYFVI